MADERFASEEQVPQGAPASVRPPARDVFVSYNSDDRDLVVGLVDALRAAGVSAWFDRLELQDGGRWQDEIAAGLAGARSCAVCVGPSGVGDWSRMELMAALDRAAKDFDFRVFPVLLPGVGDPVDAGALPPFLLSSSWVDLRSGWAGAAALQPLVNAIHGVAPGDAVDGPTLHDDAVAPYVGLRAFEPGDAVWYFGREAEVQRLVEQLRRSSFLAVVGPSGSGKSSLVRAGLIPALQSGALEDAMPWRVVPLTPGARPLESLATALWTSFPEIAGGLAALTDELSSDPRALRLRTSALLSGSSERVLWLVDQFEELFTLCHDEAERRQFVDLLLHASAPGTARNVVVTTMRSDFYGELATFPELARLVESRQFLVQRMGPTELRRVVEAPARAAGLEVEAGLAQTILRDVAGQAGALPLVQHALFETWQLRRGNQLTVEAYQAVGGVDGALARTAERVFERLRPEEQDASRRLFLRLTRLGEGTEDTRRRVDGAELAADPAPGAIEAVVESFAAARLLTTDASPGPDGEPRRHVEVAHEALIRSWPRLRAWIDEDRAALQLHRRITHAATEWDDHDRDPALFWRGSPLVQAEELREARDDLDEREAAFVSASAEARDREASASRRRGRIAVGALAAGLAVATGLGVLANQQRSEAEANAAEAASQSALAQRSEVQAQVRALAAEARDAISRDPDLAVHLGLQAVELSETVDDHPDPKAVSALLEATLDHRLTHVLPFETHVARPIGEGRLLIWPDNDDFNEDTFFVWDVERQERVLDLDLGNFRPADFGGLWPWGDRLPPKEGLLRVGGQVAVAAIPSTSGRGVAVWDLTDGSVRRLSLPSDLVRGGTEVREAQVDPTGRWVYGEVAHSSQVPSVPLVWDLRDSSQEPMRLPNRIPGGWSLDPAISPEGLIAYRGLPDDVEIGTQPGEVFDTMLAHEVVVVHDLSDATRLALIDYGGQLFEGALAFDGSGERLLIRSKLSPELGYYDARTGDRLAGVSPGSGSGAALESICVVAGSGSVVGLIDEVGLRRWSLPDLEPLGRHAASTAEGGQSTTGNQRYPSYIDCAPDEPWLVLRREEGSTEIWDVGPVPRSMGAPSSSVYDVAPGPEGVVVAWHTDGTITTRDEESGAVVASVDGQHQSLIQAVVDPTGRWAAGALADDSTTVRVLRLPSLETYRLIRPYGPVPAGSGVAFPERFSPDGRYLVITGSLDNAPASKVFVVDVMTGETVLSVEAPISLNGVAWLDAERVLLVVNTWYGPYEHEGGLLLDVGDGRETHRVTRLEDMEQGFLEASASVASGTVLLAGFDGGAIGHVHVGGYPDPDPVSIPVDGSRSRLDPTGQFVLAANGQTNSADRLSLRRVDGSVVWHLDEGDTQSNFANFSRDGRHVLAARGNGPKEAHAVLRLPTSVTDLIDLARSRLTRDLLPHECAQYLWPERCAELGLVEGQ